MKIIVPCGGYGTKLWPLSRRKNPKQFAPLIDGKSPFRVTLDVLLEKFSPEDIFISGSLSQIDLIRDQSSEIPEENWLLECEYRNTGAAMALCMAKLFTIDPDETFINIQSDVIREPKKKFFETLDVLDKIVQRTGKLATGGLSTEDVVAGVDYLLLGKDLSSNYVNSEVYECKEYMSRDRYDEILSSIKNGEKIVSHANHYAWTPKAMIDAFVRNNSDYEKPINDLIEMFSSQDYSQEDFNELFKNLPSGKIEEEVTINEFPNSIIVNIPFKWMDLGTWSSIKSCDEHFDVKKHDRTICIEAENNYIRARKDKVVAIIGLDDIVVVDTEDGLLITKLDQSGKVGDIVKEIENKSWKEYL